MLAKVDKRDGASIAGGDLAQCIDANRQKVVAQVEPVAIAINDPPRIERSLQAARLAERMPHRCHFVRGAIGRLHMQKSTVALGTPEVLGKPGGRTGTGLVVLIQDLPAPVGQLQHGIGRSRGPGCRADGFVGPPDHPPHMHGPAQSNGAVLIACPVSGRRQRIVNAVVASPNGQIHTAISRKEQVSEVVLELSCEGIDQLIGGLGFHALCARQSLLLEKIGNAGKAGVIGPLRKRT